jgi:hypothetical protein
MGEKKEEKMSVSPQSYFGWRRCHGVGAPTQHSCIMRHGEKFQINDYLRI